MVNSAFLNELILIVILIILQVFTLFFAWRIGKILGEAKFWIFIILALSVIIIRRLTALLILFEVIEYSSLINSIDNTYIPLVFWFFFLIGMYDLYQRIKYIKSKKH